MDMILDTDFTIINDSEVEFINGGTPFGFAAGVFTSAAGVCAIGGGISALEGAEAGSTFGPWGAIIICNNKRYTYNFTII